MKIPFLFESTFTTSLSKKDITNYVSDLGKKVDKLWIFKNHQYEVEILNDKFKIQKRYNQKSGPSYPSILLELISENPTVVNIRIVPKYFRILFFMIFPILFLPVFLLSETIRINGVVRVPELWERLIFIGLGGILPIIWCYFDCINPVDITKKWIIEELKLNEIV